MKTLSIKERLILLKYKKILKIPNNLGMNIYELIGYLGAQHHMQYIDVKNVSIYHENGKWIPKILEIPCMQNILRIDNLLYDEKVYYLRMATGTYEVLDI